MPLRGPALLGELYGSGFRAGTRLARHQDNAHKPGRADSGPRPSAGRPRAVNTQERRREGPPRRGGARGTLRESPGEAARAVVLHLPVGATKGCVALFHMPAVLLALRPSLRSGRQLHRGEKPCVFRRHGLDRLVDLGFGGRQRRAQIARARRLLLLAAVCRARVAVARSGVDVVCSLRRLLLHNLVDLWPLPHFGTLFQLQHQEAVEVGRRQLFVVQQPRGVHADFRASVRLPDLRRTRTGECRGGGRVFRVGRHRERRRV
mmetsp:Transcript_82323/g.237819  ORF Transcript_82323/g.237819 Transcript_82323/m.237819 type:complete len:262 (-) Transcript_82323:51-836(-)